MRNTPVKNTEQNETVAIGGKIFSKIKDRMYHPISVYKGDDTFLRIGQKDLVLNELSAHKKFLDKGFDAPEIIGQGEIDGKSYFIEKSLGEKTIGMIFADEFAENRLISEESFKKLLTAVERFAGAQLKALETDDGYESFYRTIHVNDLIRELPHLKDKVYAGLDKFKKRISKMPIVLSHGDFKAGNILVSGIIDFERTCVAPAGYDLISCVVHPYLYPPGINYEKNRQFEFSREQIDSYFSLIDSIYKQNNLLPLSDIADDLIFSRIMWFVARMDQYPKLQKWGYEKFYKTLESYLAGKNISGMVIKNEYF